MSKLASSNIPISTKRAKKTKNISIFACTVEITVNTNVKATALP